MAQRTEINTPEETRVPVFSVDGHPISPTTPQKARLLVRGGQARFQKRDGVMSLVMLAEVPVFSAQGSSIAPMRPTKARMLVRADRARFEKRDGVVALVMLPEVGACIPTQISPTQVTVSKAPG